MSSSTGFAYDHAELGPIEADRYFNFVRIYCEDPGKADLLVAKLERWLTEDEESA